MVSIELPNSAEKSRSLLAVRKFATQVLEHPLLTEDARERRKMFPGKVASFLSTNKVSIDHCAVVPWGDFMWGPEEGSDYDMTITTADSKTANQIWSTQYSLPEMDVKGVAHIDRLASINETWPYVSLFIPDEYIVGDLPLIHRVRKLLTASTPEMKRKYEKFATLVFDNFFRNWRSMDWYRYADPQIQDKRAIHFNKLLSERSLQSHDPEKWKKAFLHNLETLHIPDFNCYHDAMIISSGALNLLPHYKSQGIIATPSPHGNLAPTN